jgi:hypothetical protein
MFWKVTENGRPIYLAIKSMTPVRENETAFGQRHFALHLADGTIVEHTFSHEAWEKFEETWIMNSPLWK